MPEKIVFAGITDTVRRAVGGLTGSERVITAITVALEQMRSDPSGGWCSARVAPGIGEIHASPVLAHLAAELTGITAADPQAPQWDCATRHVAGLLARREQSDRTTNAEALRRTGVQRLTVPAHQDSTATRSELFQLRRR